MLSPGCQCSNPPRNGHDAGHCCVCRIHPSTACTHGRCTSAGSCCNNPCNFTQGGTVTLSTGSSTWRRSLCQWDNRKQCEKGLPLPHEMPTNFNFCNPQRSYNLINLASKAKHELRTLSSQQRFARPSFQSVVVESTSSSVNAHMALTIKANRIGLMFHNMQMRPTDERKAQPET
eukprot:680886-Amphidinium_carterae.1